VRNVERIDPLSVAPLRLRDALARAIDGGPTVALTELTSEQSEDLARLPESAALLIETGGSTGAPKIVALSANALKISASLSNQTLGAEIGDRWSLSLPLNHIAGVNQLLRSIELGTDPVETNAQFISIVPTQLYRALERPDRFLEQLRSAKKVLIGGAAVPENLVKRGRESGIKLVTSYGMTEMCGGCIYNGKTLPGVEIKIDSSSKIALKGPMRALGYLNNNQANRESFVNEWFITSDYGSINEEGELNIAGRADDVIISGGEKISTGEVSRILQERFPESEIFVVGVPDSEWGVALRVVIANRKFERVNDISQMISLQEVRNLLGGALGKVAAPRSLLLLSELPMKSNGKADLEALAAATPTEKI
jgi:O-succinylbenzoic acid--CoA ligase